MNRASFFRRVLPLFLLAFGAGGLTTSAAETSSTWLETSASTTAAYLGEPFRFTLTAGVRNAAVQMPGAEVAWTGLRLLNYSEQDVSQRHEGYNARQAVYTLSAFILDKAEITPLPVKLTWPDGTTAVAYSQPFSLEILSLHPEKNFELRDARPPHHPGLFWLYWAALPALLGVIWLGWLRPRHRRRLRTPLLLPPHLEAFREIHALGKSRAVAEGRVDHYFTELSRVLRHYLSRRYELLAMEQPRREIVAALIVRQVPLRARRLVNSLLIRADLVKFAKVDVDFPQIAQAQRRAHQFIELTQPTPESNGKQKKKRKLQPAKKGKRRV